MKRLARATWLVPVALAWACGLDRGGLLADPDPDGGPSDAQSVVEGGLADTTVGDDGGPEPDGTTKADAGPDGEAGDAHPDAPRDAPAEARRDARADAADAEPGDGEAPDVATMDVDADLADVAADAPPDGAEDAPDETGLDASPDTGAPSLPLRWDGGSVADPIFTFSEWTGFCAALVACGELPSLSACVALQAQPSSPDALVPPPALVNAVGAAVPSCAAVAAALGDGSPCSASTADTCAGNSLVTCRFGFRMTVDCGGLGMVCSDGSTGGGTPGGATCGFGDCAPSQEGTTYCADSWLVRCTSGRFVPMLDCGEYQAICVGPDGSAGCQGTSNTLCSGVPDSCSGASISSCLGGHAAGLDCANLYDPSFKCLTSASGPVVCGGGTSCDGTHSDTCMGPMDDVMYCAAGMVAPFHCKAAGYSGCSQGACTP